MRNKEVISLLPHMADSISGVLREEMGLRLSININRPGLASLTDGQLASIKFSKQKYNSFNSNEPLPFICILQPRPGRSLVLTVD